MHRRLAIAIGVVGLFVTAPRAMQLAMDLGAIQEASAIGQSSIEQERTRFHAAYHLGVDAPPIDYIEVVTPFRRVVLGAQARAVAGTGFTQRQALELLATAPDQLDLHIELTFHPMNTYVGIPAYDVVLLPAANLEAKPIEPRSLERVPRFGPRVQSPFLPSPNPVPQGQGLPITGNQSMSGGTVIASFNGRGLDPNGIYIVRFREAGRDVARTRIDLRAFR